MAEALPEDVGVGLGEMVWEADGLGLGDPVGLSVEETEAEAVAVAVALGVGVRVSVKVNHGAVWDLPKDLPKVEVTWFFCKRLSNCDVLYLLFCVLAN